MQNKQDLPRVVIYTDGSCLGNPGPGGWAAVLSWGEAQKEISGGLAGTTNNRMELLAAIQALKSLKKRCQVDLYTDSRYLHDALRKGWLKRWQKNGWQTAAKNPVKNQDLWQELQKLLDRHQVSLHWVQAHQGQEENELCDRLAKEQAARTDLPVDSTR
ncbi:MAG: ribonuclease HI [Desulfohalobiaceae bacterium]